jgi:hypothetical protein
MILLALLCYLVIALTVTSISWKKSGIRSALLTLFLFTAPLWDIAPGYIYFKMLCATSAGVHMYAKPDMNKNILIDNVWLSNYGCSSYCIKALYEEKLDSIEVEVSKPALEYLTDESAFYKFYLAQKDDKNCELFYSYLKNNGDKYKKITGIVGENYANCIASEKITSPTANYSAKDEYISQYTVYPNISSHVTRIADVKTNRTIAESISYIYRGGWLETLLNEKGNPRHCPSSDNVKNSLMHIDLVSDVFGGIHDNR